MDYLEFGELSSDPEADTRIQDVKEYLSEKVGKHDLAAIRQSGTILQDNAEELVIEDQIQTMSVRITQLKNVRFDDRDSYKESNRAKQVAKLSTQKMMAVEEETGRSVENYLMARRLERGEAPKMPMHLPAADHPEGRENRKAWHKTMRSESNREFWLGTTRQARDSIRCSAMRPPDSLIPIIAQIEEEDNSRSEDFFWNHQRDEAATADDDTYGKQEHDIVIFLDCHGHTLVCKVGRLFQLLFGEERMSKVDSAIRQWSSLPPLPVPDSRRHIVNDYIRTKHPELDLEKAKDLKELEERHQCVVHYGTWAAKGHGNPDHVHLTPDTGFRRGFPRYVEQIYPTKLFPIFRTKVLGLASEVVRFVFESVDPKEYQECLNVFNALSDTDRIDLSSPTFSTLTVVGINTFTGRHRDKNDVHFGLASLVSLGSYTGAELEHFVTDWSGYRIFLLFTNHQPVRNYAHRVLGKLPPKINDPWHPARQRQAGQGERMVLEPEEEPDVEAYDPCQTEPVEQEPEDLTEEDIHGAALIDSASSDSTCSEETGSPGLPAED
ncbi:hypothetical protein DL770_008372 [Monosporascus sp. CRB-9-2]|nr:hypothetical protein DL770_008372 [Monosporascus sp. CRB-9-2]